MRFPIFIITIGTFALSLSWSAYSTAQVPAISSTKTAKLSEKRVYADFYHIMYTYFEQDYVGTLNQIEKSARQHKFDALSDDDKDRLTLITGAAQLNLGLSTLAQKNFLSLLNKNSSQYVKANTWFWLARTGFENNQPDLSAKAYEAVSANNLEAQLSTKHWQSLLYMAAYTRMHNGEEWQDLLVKLEDDSIYAAYLLANRAGRDFNSENYEASTNGFVAAKRALLQYQAEQQSFTRRALGLTRNLGNAAVFYLSPWRWFSDDPNKQAQGRQSEAAAQQAKFEQDALFDRLNLQLAYSLLKQQDDVNALAVINNVSAESGDSQQALLTLGWTHAQQNRWQAAVDIWQYLHAQGPGIFQLQASYGLAYAYQQQGQFVEAFYALEETGAQISATLDSLAQFEQDIAAEDFFDSYQSQWPIELLDVKRTFLRQSIQVTESDKGALDSIKPIIDVGKSADVGKSDHVGNQHSNENPHYLLSARQQLKGILTTLSNKAKQLEVLKGLLKEREFSFTERINGLSLDERAVLIANTSQHAESIQEGLNPTNENARQALMLSMMNGLQKEAWLRLESANARHERLLIDPPRNKPLKSSYQKRLSRIEGILRWQMENDYVANRWAHLRKLDEVSEALAIAQRAYKRVDNIGITNEEFSATSSKIDVLEKQIVQRLEQTAGLYQRVESRLLEHLKSVIALRTEQLKTQWVNTRLAKIRLQDLQGEALIPKSSSTGDSQ